MENSTFWQINVRLAGGDWKIGMILLTKWFKKWIFQKMSITTKMPLNWYSSMKKKIRKIRIIFYIENWLWKSEIGIFWSLDLESILIYQKCFLMKKCYFPLNVENVYTIWCGSCWNYFKCYLLCIFNIQVYLGISLLNYVRTYVHK